MLESIDHIINLENNPLDSPSFRRNCKQTLDEKGVLVMPEFLTQAAINMVCEHGIENQYKAYYTADNHNIYLTESDPDFPADHPRNRLVTTSKGCITTDQIPDDCALHSLYKSQVFKEFLCVVLDEPELHEYADPLSSINIHYAGDGQELGWHFDNSSFAITLMIQAPDKGGEFNYVKDVRDADNNEMNYELAGKILDEQVPVDSLNMNAGTLVLFRGRNSMHRVTPVEGDTTRMLVVLAYNSQPGIHLSESARMTFYGRLD